MYLLLLFNFCLFLQIPLHAFENQRVNSKFLKDFEEEDIESGQCTESCASAINRSPDDNKLSNEINHHGILDNKYSELDTDNDGEMVRIESGTFEMGSNDVFFKADREGPVRNITVGTFLLDAFAVTNQQFKQFIKQSGYVTEAEKFGNSFVFDQLLPDDQKNSYPDMRALHAKWWVKLDGVLWAHPEGPESDIHDRMNHPVVHVSWNDAKAYCEYYRKRLPTEEEWEKGCRGGLKQKLYPWGNNFIAKNIHRANIWHGEFPHENTKDDGCFGTCPVDQFPPNNYGLYNMVGNVWEWTSTLAFPHSKADRIKKGGSFMCHKSYCYRYRCAARSHNTDDSTASNLSFRCAKSI